LVSYLWLSEEHISGIDLELKELKQITAHCGFSKKSENMATVEHLQKFWYGRGFVCVCVCVCP